MATLIKKKDLKVGSTIFPSEQVRRLPKWLQNSTVVKADGQSTAGYVKVKKYLEKILPDDVPSESIGDVVKTQKKYAKAQAKDKAKPLEKRKAQTVFKSLIAYATVNTIREQAGDQWARWVPSSAKDPDSEHMLNYGKVFKVSDGINGELPADRYGCQCGIQFISEAEAKRSL